MELSKRAKILFEFIENYIRENHFGPTRDEMSKGCGLKSKSDVWRYLEILKNVNRIGYVKEIPRAIWLIQDTIGTKFIRIGGSISAGTPLSLMDLPDEEVKYLPVPADQLPLHLKAKELVAFRANGDSMIDANIQDGDWVVLARNREPRDGQMGAFEIDSQELTLKKYYRNDDSIVLQPANPKYPTLTFYKDRVEPKGIVVWMSRMYSE